MKRPWKIHNIQLLILGGEITLSIKEVISKLTLWLPLLRDSVLNPTRQTVSNLLQSFLSRERGWSKILEEFRWSSQRKSIIPTIMSLPLILKWSRSVMSDPVDCSPPGSSIHGILQARILEWVAISFSRGSPGPRDWTRVSCLAGRCFNLWATREAPEK